MAAETIIFFKGHRNMVRWSECECGIQVFWVLFLFIDMSNLLPASTKFFSSDKWREIIYFSQP